MHIPVNKKVILNLCIVLLSINFSIFAQTQESGEVGIALGGSYYLGDLNKIPFQGTQLSAGVFYRHTFDTRYALLGSVNYGKLKGDPDNSTFDPTLIQPFNITIYEVEGTFEYNFKPFLPASRKYDYTPYVFAGIGTTYLPKATQSFIFNIPFGIGLKYNINQHFVFGCHLGMRKTFVDNIDYDYHPPTENNTTFHQYGYAGNKDWYSVFGVSLSYKINYRMKCPAFD